MDRANEVVGLVTDSSCDLPMGLIERFNVAVIPLVVHIGAEAYLDGELPVEVFWRHVRRGRHVPRTSQPSVGAFEKAFGRLIAQGKRVLCVTLTGRHTGTIETARLAAKRFGEAVYVFDSRSLSLGMGFQVLEAAQASQVGRSLDEIVGLLQDVRSRVHALVVLDTLENVRRGGRADAFIAVVQRMSRWLSVKPIVSLVEGEVQLLGVARSLRSGLQRIGTIVEEVGPLDHLGVMHSRNAELAKDLADQLAAPLAFPRDEILVGETGAVVASHAGAGAVGIFAVSRRREEDVCETTHQATRTR